MNNEYITMEARCPECNSERLYLSQQTIVDWSFEVEIDPTGKAYCACIDEIDGEPVNYGDIHCIDCGMSMCRADYEQDFQDFGKEQPEQKTEIPTGQLQLNFGD